MSTSGFARPGGGAGVAGGATRVAQWLRANRRWGGGDVAGSAISSKALRCYGYVCVCVCVCVCIRAYVCMYTYIRLYYVYISICIYIHKYNIIYINTYMHTLGMLV